MSKTKDSPGAEVDGVMERASRALVERKYFEAERLCLEAMEKAHAESDYERMARVVLPLQEARRQKRDLAVDAGRVFVIDSEVPAPDTLEAGCYLVKPPRVGLDGRLLREMADRREVPAIVLVREPRTRAGMWPLVALGPVTVRTPVMPPVAAAKKAPANKGKKPAKPAAPVDADAVLPPVTWFLDAAERLGDSALASIDPNRSVIGRVEDVLMRLAAHPDHEKLHQALEAACREAARLPERERKHKPTSVLEDDDGLDDANEDGATDEDGRGDRAAAEED